MKAEAAVVSAAYSYQLQSSHWLHSIPTDQGDKSTKTFPVSAASKPPRNIWLPGEKKFMLRALLNW